MPGKPSNATSLALVSSLISADVVAQLNHIHFEVNNAVAAVIDADRPIADITVNHEVSGLFASFNAPGSMDVSDKIVTTSMDVLTTLHKVVKREEAEAGSNPIDRIAELEKEVEQLKAKLKGCSCEKPTRSERSGSGRHGYSGLPKQGMEGGPCGKTNYKDFGKCREAGKNLFCQSAGILFGHGWSEFVSMFAKL